MIQEDILGALKTRYEHYRALAMTLFGITLALCIAWLQTILLISTPINTENMRIGVIHTLISWFMIPMMILLILSIIYTMKYYYKILKIQDPNKKTTTIFEKFDDWLFRKK